MGNDFEEKLRKIREIADGLCRDVMMDRASKPFTGRGLLVCSASGTGMTHLLDSVLKDNHLRRSNDYYDISCGDVSEEGLYETFYKNNGKLIFEIDAHNDIFSGRRRMKFWQQLLRDDYLYWPGELSELSKLGEVLPAKFRFSGYVVIFSHMTYEELLRNVVDKGNTPEEWREIWHRLNGIEVFPTQAELWDAIQLELRREQRESPEVLPDRDCLVPRKDIDAFLLDIYNRINQIKDKTKVPFTWRQAVQLGAMLKGSKGQSLFKYMLEQIFESPK